MASRSSERLARLAGSGKGWGGGLPLPQLFQALLNELLDRETMTTDRAVEIATDVMGFKTNQIITNQAMGGPRAPVPDWETFTDDVLTQMESKHIIRRNGDGWRTDPAKFATGTFLEIIPATRDRKRDGAAVWPREEREARSRAAHADAERISRTAEQRQVVHAFDERLRGAGLRAVTPARVQEIRDSIAEYGDLSSDFPVLEDQHRNLIDGWHRRAVNPDWPARRIEIATEEDRLRAALVANLSRAWTKAEWDQMQALTEAVGGQRTKRERTREALLEQAGMEKPLVHNVIAKRLEVTHRTVDLACAEVIATGSNYAECPHRWREDGKRASGPRPKSKDALAPDPRQMLDPGQEEELIAAVAAGASNAEIRGRFNLTQDAASKEIKAAKAVLRERQRAAQRERAAIDAEQAQAVESSGEEPAGQAGESNDSPVPDGTPAPEVKDQDGEPAMSEPITAHTHHVCRICSREWDE